VRGALEIFKYSTIRSRFEGEKGRSRLHWIGNINEDIIWPCRQHWGLKWTWQWLWTVEIFNILIVIQRSSCQRADYDDDD